jgi:tetratricopeptide (TPR) repeat protein
MALPYAAGSLYSTAEDLLLWERSLDTEKLVSRKSLDELFTPVLSDYGYGWHVGEKFGRKILDHGGSIRGFSSYLLRFPAEQLTVIVLSNSERTSATRVANALAAISLGQAYVLPRPKLFDVLSAAVAKEGVAHAIETYRVLRRDRPKDFDFGESVLNDLGYELLGANKVADALELFRLNVEMWPRSANVYDSLGEAYLHSGDKKLALESYARSLELDPKNQNAARALAKLRGSALD